MTSSQIKETALKMIEGFNQRDLDVLIGLRSPSCLHHILPSSLKRPPMTNDDFAAWFPPLMDVFQTYSLKVHDIVVDSSVNKVAMHVTSNGSSPVGDYHNEYMVILHMNDDGTKVDAFFEFTDSLYSAEYFAKLRALQSEKKDKKPNNL